MGFGIDVERLLSGRRAAQPAALARRLRDAFGRRPCALPLCLADINSRRCSRAPFARRAADGRVRRRRRRVDDILPCRRRGPLLSCAAYALLAGAQILFDELFPLYARGCLEWKPPRIGRFLALGGGSLLIGSFAAPHVLRLSSGNASRVFVFCNLLNVPLGIIVPALSSFAGLFPVYVSLRVTQTVAFCQVMLLVNTSAPMSELGAVNGLGQTLAAAMRLGPLGGGRRGPGASLARDSGAAAETCPGVYAYLPYGARAFLVVPRSPPRARCRRRRPPSMTSTTTRSARTPTTRCRLRRRRRRRNEAWWRSF